MKNVKPIGVVWSFIIMAIYVAVQVLDRSVLGGGIADVTNGNTEAIGVIVGLLSGLLTTYLQGKSVNWTVVPKPEDGMISTQSVSWTKVSKLRYML